MSPFKMKLRFKKWRAKKRNRLLQQVIPIQGADNVDNEEDRLPSRYLNRPAFSLPLMTNNFRRFNARYGLPSCFTL